MSFQAYLDNIEVKTGNTPEDFKKLAGKKGLLKPGVKAGEIIAWLKKDYNLGYGHSMAIYAVLSDANSSKIKPDEAIAKHFSGAKHPWRSVFDNLISNLKRYGNDISIAPTNSYLSLLKGNKKFAIVQITSDRMDIGIKLKGAEPTDRFELSGSWNSMVTHRTRILNPKQMDKELMSWLHKAYEKA